ncbi:O-antigen translocase [Shewanella sp. KJ2020]|uniref:O-antigen translocase n=1 Tax=Shewanella sp. KJ2020 TaxID=2919172 RepID=UPI002657356F|nr:O-antigen translocase [Shewanella sp. KJ2020]
MVKTSILSFIATAIKMLVNLIINKFVALFIGPTGLAVIGQFQNATLLANSFSSAGINNGVIKYTSEYGEDLDSKKKLWGTSLRLTLICSSVTSVFLLFFSENISSYLFSSLDYSYVFIVFGLTLVFFSVNQLLLSIINGLKEISLFIQINIMQSLSSLLFTGTLILFFGIDGALISLVTNQAIVFVIILFKLKGHKEIIISNFSERFNRNVSKKLLSYSFMALVSALCYPISSTIIRNYIGSHLSWDYAGYWQAMVYISSMYLMVITTMLSTYFLPRISELKDKDDIKLELLRGGRLILPLVLFLAVTIFYSKHLIVNILFSAEFEPMLELFKWQLVGDVVKIFTWLLVYVLLAKAMTKLFVLSEVIFSVTSVLFSMFFITHSGFVGLSYAFALNYFLSFIFMLLIVLRYLFWEK